MTSPDTTAPAPEAPAPRKRRFGKYLVIALAGPILLLALGDDRALPGAAALQIHRQVLLGEGDTGGAAVDDDHVAGAVALPGGGDAQRLPEGAAGHGYSAPICRSPLAVRASMRPAPAP